MPKVKMLVYTNSLEGRDADFNRWYDEIHLPEVIRYSAAVAAQRFRLSDAQPAQTAQPGDGVSHRYLAIYEFEIESKQAYESLTASTAQMDLGDSLDPATAKVVFYDDIGERIGG